MDMLGIDVGGSGIKGAPVNTETGELSAERFRLPTPTSAKPKAMTKTMAQIVEHFHWQGPVGCGFPAAIRQGVVLTASNIHESWIGTNGQQLLEEATGSPVRLLNDADAAGIAEMAFGAGRGRRGLVLIVTIGTGLGTALFTDGYLVPNCELGHIEVGGKDGEWYASDAARKREDLSWTKWAKRFDEYLRTMENLFWPDLIVLGGGGSKKGHKFLNLLTVRSEVVLAELLNEAGIVGAALAAHAWYG